MEDPELSEFCCQNERCFAYGSYGAKNLSVCDRIGKRRHIRLLYCRVCRKRPWQLLHQPNRESIWPLAHFHDDGHEPP